MMFVGPWDFSVMMLWFWDLFLCKSEQSLDKPDGSCGSVSLIPRVIRFWMFPQSMFLVGRFFFSLNQPSLTNHVGDQPVLKWGYPFEQATLGITAAGDAFAAVALKPPHLQAAALGRKHCLPTPSLWTTGRNFASTATLKGKCGCWVMGGGD